jgi:pyruvate,water dikinase
LPKVLTGRGVVNGTVRGTARIANADGSNVKEGDILISRMTDAKMYQGMIRAEGIVTEHGGTICHAAIVALELGKVTAVGVKGLMSAVKDGMEIEIEYPMGSSQATVRIL